MAFTRLTDDLDIIAALDDEPNDVGGLTAAQLKAKFDEAPNAIKDFINDELLPALESTAVSALLGFAATSGVPAATVQAAIENVQAQIAGVTLGQIPDNTVTNAKLLDGTVEIGKMAVSDASAVDADDDELLLYDTVAEAMKKAQISDILSLGPKIGAGFYIGTGTSGESNKNSLVLPVIPDVMYIWPTADNGSRYMRAPASGSRAEILYRTLYESAETENKYALRLEYGNSSFAATENTFRVSFSADGLTVYWYDENYIKQLNNSGYKYYYWWMKAGGAA